MTPKPEFSLAFAAATDIGCKRGNNEDSYGYDADQHIYVVCDGMGGSAAGEVASGMAVRALIESFEAQSMGLAAGEVPAPVEERLLKSITEANRAVREAAESNEELHTMGTTLVCACRDGTRLVIGNVGDSRAYLIRSGSCMQITEDHSFLDEQIRSGMMTPEVAAASNLQSVITRAVGVTDTVEPDLFAVDLTPGDMFLLTSDGLTRYLKADEIASLAPAGADLSAICSALIEQAKDRGGADNITCIMLRVVPGAHADADPEIGVEPPAIES